jgi:hypothetical protein
MLKSKKYYTTIAKITEMFSHILGSEVGTTASRYKNSVKGVIDAFPADPKTFFSRITTNTSDVTIEPLIFKEFVSVCNVKEQLIIN